MGVLFPARRRTTARGPFERHLREAIALNEARAGRYAALSGGASLTISRTLIGSEQILLPLARWFDQRAERYHRAGVPLLEELFVSMEDVPPFRTAWGQALTVELPPQQPWRLALAVLSAYLRAGFEGAAVELERALDRLAAAPQLSCMLRHLLESSLRLCLLAPRHERLARERGLPSPLRLLALLLGLHCFSFVAGSWLDRRAYPLQRQGLPILAQDLPPIPRP